MILISFLFYLLEPDESWRSQLVTRHLVFLCRIWSGWINQTGRPTLPWFHMLHTNLRDIRGVSRSFLQPSLSPLSGLSRGLHLWIDCFAPVFESLLVALVAQLVSMHLTAMATHYFCLSHLPHPVFSSELRSHLSMFWVAAKRNQRIERHLCSV